MHRSAETRRRYWNQVTGQDTQILDNSEAQSAGSVHIQSKISLLTPFYCATGSFIIVNVLGTDRIPPDVHHIAHGDVAQDIQHPDHMVHGRDISIVPIVVEDSSRGGDPLVLQQVVVPRDVATAHVREAVGQVGLLPLPPEAVDVGVMQIEQGVSGAGALELELLIWSAVMSGGNECRAW